jgi:hypothetical protein
MLLRKLNQSARVTEGEKEILPISRGSKRAFGESYVLSQAGDRRRRSGNRTVPLPPRTWWCIHSSESFWEGLAAPNSAHSAVMSIA